MGPGTRVHVLTTGQRSALADACPLLLVRPALEGSFLGKGSFMGMYITLENGLPHGDLERVYHMMRVHYYWCASYPLCIDRSVVGSVTLKNRV